MAKVYPIIQSNNNNIESSSSSNPSSYTVWMKSLVMQGNGCTVYNGNGDIVYRVDNYDQKNSNEVFLMDLSGKVLFTILRKRMWVLSSWEGHRSNGLKSKHEKPLFQVGKSCNNILGKDFSCKVTLKLSDDDQINGVSWFRLEGSPGKSALKIIDNQGRLVAEAKRKQSSTGVILGDDVLTLVIEQSVDHSLVMALVTVYGLMHRKV